MDWRPTATRQALELRATVLARVRAHFSEHPALEVDTPVLSSAAPTDPNIHTIDASGSWLHTSPEFPMKRLLAAGVGDCWQVCKVFRAGERGRLHNPEFTLLEWYRVGIDDHALMVEVDALVRSVLDGHRALPPTTTVTYAAAWRSATGVDFALADVETCRMILAAADVGAPDTLDLGELHDLIMGILVMPHLGRDGPCFITDFPAAQASLARLRDADPAVAGRFELVIDGLEIANGYHELADAVEQRRRFAADNELRRVRGLPEMPIDQRLLAALAHGLPECAGVALGLDRLLMVALGADSLEAVLAFPVERA